MKKKRKVDFGAYAFLIPAAVIYLSVIVVPVFYSLFIQCVVKPLVSTMGSLKAMLQTNRG